jgi:hypothetical protein
MALIRARLLLPLLLLLPIATTEARVEALAEALALAEETFFAAPVPGTF